ncbi:MAG: NfeD family protein [Eubacterium sp.]|nr:NfeD family protein [Eubacterium sp.]
MGGTLLLAADSSGMSDASKAGLIWLGIFAFMIVAEIASVGLTAIWFAGGAVVVSVAAFLGVDVVWQIIIFMVVSLVLLIVLRPLAKKKMLKHITPTNVESLIGQIYPVLSKIGPGHEAGQIKIGDVEWRAISEEGTEIPESTVVEILRIEGSKLVVKPKV